MRLLDASSMAAETTIVTGVIRFATDPAWPSQM